MNKAAEAGLAGRTRIESPHESPHGGAWHARPHPSPSPSPLLRIVRVAAFALLLAACAQTPTEEPPILRPTPTLLPAPQYVEPQQPITLDNIADIAYLGRLDQPDVVSTIFSYALSPDGTRLVGVNNAELLEWDLLTGALGFTTSRAGVTQVFYSSDKTEIYGLDTTGTVTIFDAGSGVVSNRLQAHPAPSNVAVFHAEAGLLAVGGQDGSLKVWDLFERTALATVDAHDARIDALAFSPDGERLATSGAESIVRLWAWRAGRMESELKIDDRTTTRLVFSPDGEQLAIGTNRDPRLWNLTDFEAITGLQALENGIRLLMYSPDNAYLVGGSEGDGLLVWNPASGGIIGQLPDLEDAAQMAMDFSPDSTMLLTAALGGAVTIWRLTPDADEAINRVNLPVETDQILSVEWTDDRRALLLFDATGPIYVWGLPSAD